MCCLHSEAVILTALSQISHLKSFSLLEVAVLDFGQNVLSFNLVCLWPAWLISCDITSTRTKSCRILWSGYVVPEEFFYGVLRKGPAALAFRHTYSRKVIPAEHSREGLSVSRIYRQCCCAVY